MKKYGEQTNPRKTNPANNRKCHRQCYSGKKIRNWHVCEIVEIKNGKVRVIVEKIGTSVK